MDGRIAGVHESKSMNGLDPTIIGNSLSSCDKITGLVIFTGSFVAVSFHPIYVYLVLGLSRLNDHRSSHRDSNFVGILHGHRAHESHDTLSRLSIQMDMVDCRQYKTRKQCYIAQVESETVAAND